MTPYIRVTLAITALFITSCGDTNRSTSASYQQVDRVGRPAINEGLIVTNAYLTAFNEIPPSMDLSAASAPVLKEAATVLALIQNYATLATLTPPSTASIVGGFLPDVMRIDTTIDVPSSSAAGTTTGKANAVQAYFHASLIEGTAYPILVGGRKLTDDVINITMSYLFGGATVAADSFAISLPFDDKVSYYHGAATNCATAVDQTSTPANPGHHCLNGQTALYGTATFPYLAAPN